MKTERQKQTIFQQSALKNAAFILGFLLLIVAGKAYGQGLSPDQTIPVQNSVLALPDAPIELTYPEEIDAASLQNELFTIYGEHNGYYSIGSVQLLNEQKTISITATPNFLEGENIVFMMRDGVKTDGGQSVTPFRLEFRVSNRAGIIHDEFFPVDVDLISGESRPVRLTAGRFDEDEYIDLAVISHASNQVTVLRNDRGLSFTEMWAGTIAKPAETPIKNLGPSDVASGDFNDDGLVDIIVSFTGSGRVYILYKTGPASFEPYLVKDAVDGLGNQPSAITVGHFDNNDRLDFAVAFESGNPTKLFKNIGNDQVDGRARFRSSRSEDLHAANETKLVDLVHGDFEGDGDVDFAAIFQGSRSLIYWINEGSGGFGEGQRIALEALPISVRLQNVKGALGNDGASAFKEIAVLTSTMPSLAKSAAVQVLDSGRLEVFEFEKGPILGEFSLVKQTPFSFLPAAFSPISIDGDPNLEFAARDNSMDFIVVGRIEEEDTSGERLDYVLFDENAPRTLESDALNGAKDVITADFNRDGVDDIVYASELLPKLRYLRSRCAAPKQFFVDFGDVFVGNDSIIVKPIQLENSIPVRVKIVWNDKEHYRITPEEFDLPPNGVQNLTIQFSPTDTVAYPLIAEIQTDLPDAAECATELSLNGRGIRVVFNLNSEACQFPVTPPNSVSNCPILVTNDGNADLILNGFRLLSGLSEFKLPDLSGDFIVPANSSREIIAVFCPDEIGVFEDTLVINSNDPDAPQRRVILRGESTTNFPVFCDTTSVTATEDEEFCLLIKQGACSTSVGDEAVCQIRVFEDPDNEALKFRFVDVPSWITEIDTINYTAKGTPGEGDLDTTIKVVAYKQFVEVTREIAIKVEPVNDPPVIENLPETVTIDENDFLEFTVIASDPEDSLLTIFAEFPSDICGESDFVQDSETTGIFSWIPGFGCAHTHVIQFFAREKHKHDQPPPLTSAPGVLTIEVGRLIPDLVAENLSLSFMGKSVAPNEVFVGQDIDMVVEYSVQGTPILEGESFVVRLTVDGETFNFTESNGVRLNEQAMTMAFTHKFTQEGMFTAHIQVDVDDAIEEDNDENNILEVPITVSPGKVVVKRNPFTPNNDGVNDEVIFSLEELSVSSGELMIFSLSGRLVYKKRFDSQIDVTWNGRDANGTDQLPGVYIFVLNGNNKRLDEGYVTLAR